MELGSIIFMNDGILGKQGPYGIRGKVGFMTIISNNIHMATRVPALQGLLLWLTKHDDRKGKRVDEPFHGGPAWLLTKTKTNQEQKVEVRPHNRKTQTLHQFPELSHISDPVSRIKPETEFHQVRSMQCH